MDPPRRPARSSRGPRRRRPGPVVARRCLGVLVRPGRQALRSGRAHSEVRPPAGPAGLRRGRSRLTEGVGDGSPAEPGQSPRSPSSPWHDNLRVLENMKTPRTVDGCATGSGAAPQNVVSQEMVPPPVGNVKHPSGWSPHHRDSALLSGVHARTCSKPQVTPRASMVGARGGTHERRCGGFPGFEPSSRSSDIRRSRFVSVVSDDLALVGGRPHPGVSSRHSPTVAPDQVRSTLPLGFLMTLRWRRRSARCWCYSPAPRSVAPSGR